VFTNSGLVQAYGYAATLNTLQALYATDYNEAIVFADRAKAQISALVETEFRLYATPNGENFANALQASLDEV
jgi:hypothetical protein